MELKPGQFGKPYNISDTILDRGFENDVETFRGSGTDYSELGTSVIYIASVPLKRVVSLKAFVESAKYNITKTTDILEEMDKNSKVFATFDGDLEIDVTINIPAHSTNEAVNNLAKIEELQRLISPNSGYKIRDPKTKALSIENVDIDNGVVPSAFRVWFKNIISSGKEFKDYSTPRTMEFGDIMKHGFPCVIDSITYEPVLDAGFLDLNNFLYPKVIKLNLKLIMEVSQVNIRELPIEGFYPNGDYSDFDNKFFPFCVPELDVEKMNKLDYSLDQGTKNNSFFMSLEVTVQKRWVQFKPFLESFTRTHGTSITYAESKERVGKLIASDQAMTFKDLSYKFKLLIPASNLAEAKRNCAKIQYLMRMFYRPPQPVDAEEIGDGHIFASGNYDKKNPKKEYISLSNRRIKVYSPSFIEKAGSARKHDALSFDFMYKNGISMFLNSLAVDVSFDVGFFEEAGKLYPKEMSIDLDFMYDSNDLIKTYVLTNGKYTMQSSKTIKNTHLFPYNRKTVKLG
tara:strand:+ start:1083 stop:2624 length:1542 start_codon:yes stop_codon:yes gene_type:complete